METILPETTEWKGVPYVGCAATIGVGSDSYPGTVVWVSEQTVDHEYTNKDTGEKFTVKLPRRVRIRQCDYRGVEGHSNAFTEDQKYVYFDDDAHSDNPRFKGREYSYRPKRKNYVQVGDYYRSAQSPGFGFRRAYRDPHF